MALRLVFNPLSGKFDYVDTIDTSAFALPTPTTVQSDVNISAHTQLLFRRKIVLQEGQKINIGADAALVGV